MSSTNQVANTSSQNIVPVQAAFNEAGECQGLVGPGGAYFSPPLAYLQMGGVNVADATPPALGTGWGTGATIVGANTMAFKVVVGSEGADNGTITLPEANNGWIVFAQDVTGAADVYLLQTASTTTSVEVASFGMTTGTPSPMSAGDEILLNAFAF
jgi:hypothetical protein